MKKRLMLLLLPLLLIACDGQKPKKEPNQPPPNQKVDLKLQSEAFRFLMELDASIDHETMMLKDNLPSYLVYGDYIQSQFKGMKFAPDGFDHYTGEAHTHQKEIILTTGGTSVIGLLKVFTAMIDRDGNEYYDPVFMPFLNTNLVDLDPCQHIIDSERKPAYQVIGIGKLKVAYDLEPVQSETHTHIPDCHDGPPSRHMK